MKLASLLNHISVGGRVCRGLIRSSNIWGPSLLGAEFVRGRVCQGPSLLGAEMSRNRKYSGECIPWTNLLGPLDLGPVKVITCWTRWGVFLGPNISWTSFITSQAGEDHYTN